MGHTLKVYARRGSRDTDITDINNIVLAIICIFPDNICQRTEGFVTVEYTFKLLRIHKTRLQSLGVVRNIIFKEAVSILATQTCMLKKAIACMID